MIPAFGRGAPSPLLSDKSDVLKVTPDVFAVEMLDVGSCKRDVFAYTFVHIASSFEISGDCAIKRIVD